MVWFSALKLGLNAATHIYKKKQETKMAMAEPILVIAYGVFSEDPAASEKIKEFFVQFQQLPSWFTNLWILVVASIYGIKGTQIFRNGKK